MRQNQPCADQGEEHAWQKEQPVPKLCGGGRGSVLMCLGHKIGASGAGAGLGGYKRRESGGEQG